MKTSIAWLRAAIGDAWCTTEVDKLLRERRTPVRYVFGDRKSSKGLAEALLEADDGLVQIEQGGEMSYGLAYCLRLADNSRYLIGGGTPGVEHKLEAMVREPQKFRDTAYEIETGTKFAKLGKPVEFIETQDGRKTADLLANRELEVECKNISALTSASRNDRELWSLLTRRLERCQARVQQSFFVRLTCTRSLKRPDVDWTLRHLDAYLAQVQSADPDFVYEAVDALHDLRIGSYRIEATDDGITAIPSESMADQSHYELDHSMLTARANGPLVSNGMALRAQFRSMDQTAIAKRIKAALKSAVPQFSKAIPAIISVNLPQTRTWRSADDGRTILEAVRSFLAQNSTINAVVLTTDGMIEHQGVLRPAIKHALVEASNPKRPIDLSFFVPESANG